MSTKVVNIEMPVYYKCVDEDILTNIVSSVGDNNCFIDQETGKIKLIVTPVKDSPWHHVKRFPNQTCFMSHKVILSIFKLLPIDCLNCYKVVIKPATLEQLFEVVELQKKLKYPAKSGIEIRPSVFGLYGSYFYNEGLDDGISCLEEVIEEVAKNPILKPLLNDRYENRVFKRVILKRGCTEIEHMFGDSQKWEVKEDSAKKQEYIKSRILPIEDNGSLQPDYIISSIHKRWIEYAYTNGDSTYLKYTNGNTLYPQYCLYASQKVLDMEVV